MGQLPPPPIVARLDPEICVNPMRNVPWDMGGGVRQLFTGSGVHHTIYNVGIIYMILTVVYYTSNLHFFMIKNVKSIMQFNENASASRGIRPQTA